MQEFPSPNNPSPRSSGPVFVQRLLREVFETWTLESGWFLFYGFFMLMAGAALGQLPVVGILLALAVEGPLGVGLVLATRRVVLNERTGPEDLFGGFRGGTRILATSTLSLALMLLSLVGLVALLIPGLLVAALFSVALPVMVLEGGGVWDCLRRSTRMVRPRLWPVLALTLGIGLVEVLLALPTLTSLVAQAEPDTMQTLPFMLGMGLLGPLQGIFTTLLYLHLREEESHTIAQG